MKRSWLILLVAGCTLKVAGSEPSTFNFKPSTCIKAIVGEAAGDGYNVQLGVACALRNRGTLRGVYGVNARHNATEPAWVWKAAARAWDESARRDVTKGANHFGNADDVRKGTFKGMTLTVVLGEGKHTTYFFKA